TKRKHHIQEEVRFEPNLNEEGRQSSSSRKIGRKFNFKITMPDTSTVYKASGAHTRRPKTMNNFYNISSYESSDNEEGADSLSTPSSSSRVGSTRVSSSESDSDNEICDL
ncbi:hypothetical protein C0J52_25037, partial [Blattella germanica]